MDQTQEYPEEISNISTLPEPAGFFLLSFLSLFSATHFFSTSVYLKSDFNHTCLYIGAFFISLEHHFFITASSKYVVYSETNLELSIHCDFNSVVK